MAERLEIRGGVNQEQAAAIAAIVARIEADELAAASVRPRRIHQSQWVQASRPYEHQAPVPPDEYGKEPENVLTDQALQS
jgi:hypothetical protein